MPLERIENELSVRGHNHSGTPSCSKQQFRIYKSSASVERKKWVVEDMRVAGERRSPTASGHQITKPTG